MNCSPVEVEDSRILLRLASVAFLVCNPLDLLLTLVEVVALEII
jgi:hypothetical protein